jgi:hypothetical protein
VPACHQEPPVVQIGPQHVARCVRPLETATAAPQAIP